MCTVNFFMRYGFPIVILVCDVDGSTRIARPLGEEWLKLNLQTTGDRYVNLRCMLRLVMNRLHFNFTAIQPLKI